MSPLHSFTTHDHLLNIELGMAEKFSVYYHDIFDYPLEFSELFEWIPTNVPKNDYGIDYKNGYFFVKGRERLIYKRNLCKRYSQKKMKIALGASKILNRIPLVRMVGITGSLAMNNAKKNSDIDLIIITKAGHMWTCRLVVYLLLYMFGFKIRKPNNPNEEDKLCLNMWFDESDVIWQTSERNYYTAHEILQIKPIINKKNTYEHFLYKNKWTSRYWLNRKNTKRGSYVPIDTARSKSPLFERALYKIQLSYMKAKQTTEKISATRAFFHPNNLSKTVLAKITP